jgi:hypothetical protein
MLQTFFDVRGATREDQHAATGPCAGRRKGTSTMIATSCSPKPISIQRLNNSAARSRMGVAIECVDCFQLACQSAIAVPWAGRGRWRRPSPSRTPTGHANFAAYTSVVAADARLSSNSDGCTREPSLTSRATLDQAHLLKRRNTASHSRPRSLRSCDFSIANCRPRHRAGAKSPSGALRADSLGAVGEIGTSFYRYRPRQQQFLENPRSAWSHEFS